MANGTRRKGVKERRGRPRGEETVAFPLRLRPEQKRDLEVLQQILEGAPPINGLIQVAVERYVAAKLEDPAIRRQYEARLNPRLKVMG